MSVIINNIKKSYKATVIFENISARINEGDKIGLIGVNGVGKTTLMKILMGEEEYDSGSINVFPEHLKIGYLKQLNEFEENATVYQKLNSFALSASTAANNSGYGKRLKESLIKLGFKEKDMNKRVSKLSGGEKTKLSLCLVLADNPDILILDEPTNHLDVEGIKWLEDFLNSIKKTLIVISHDRLFLDNTVNKIFVMKFNEIKEYKGNYSAYKQQNDHNIKSLMNERKKQQREIKHLENHIETQMRWYHRAENDKSYRSVSGTSNYRAGNPRYISTIISKRIRIEKIKKNMKDIPKEDMSANFNLINKRTNLNSELPKYLIKVNRLKKSYGSKVIFNDAAFHVKNGDKVALMGRNGSGKTTLFKILLGLEKADSGSVYLNPSLKTGYFSQELENLNLKNTILQELVQSGIDKLEARKILGRFLFNGEEVFKIIENLSMGEKCRVAIAKLIMSEINMLILDEPTNHLDIVSKENIEDTLKEYSGTIVFVSHDRYFIDTVATRILEIENQSIKAYEGRYKYYLSKKEEDKKREQLGKNYLSIKDEIIRLECEMAFLSGKLRKKQGEEESDSEIVNRFFSTAEKLNEYRSMI